MGVKFSRVGQKWLWGDTPPGFKMISPDPIQMMMVREGLESHLCLDKFVKQRESEREAGPFYGRERLRFFHLGNGETALVRSYQHGGVFRRLTADFFFTWPPRPFRELAITEEVRRRGIPTLEILGAWVKRAWGPFYRGWLITRELHGAHDLWAALQSDLYNSRSESLLQVVAQGLRKMHRRGIYHGDLNLKNILVRQEGDKIRSTIIDFDKARLFPHEVPAEKSQKNLRRLLRSVRKLDPDRRCLSQKDWDLFAQFYQEAGEG